MNLQLPVLSVPVTTNIASANPAHGDEYSIQQCEIMFVSNLHKVKSPLGLVLYCYLNMPTINKTYLILSPDTTDSSTNKPGCHDITELLVLLNVGLNSKTITLTSRGYPIACFRLLP